MDADGHCCNWADVLNFVQGFSNAYGSDNLAGAGRQDQTSEAGRTGQEFGDFAAGVQGAGETLLGGGGEIAGTALDLTGVGALIGVPANVFSAGLIAHGTVTAAEGGGHLLQGAAQSSGQGPDGPYRRPNNATTAEQRASVQDKPCATCGATGQRNNADHKDPLVVQHYRDGRIDTSNMHTTNAVQPQCPQCSNQQGGRLSQFSKRMKRLFRF